MRHPRNPVGPSSPRTGARTGSSPRLPDVDPALRPPLYPGRDSNVPFDCPPDLVPHIQRDD